MLATKISVEMEDDYTIEIHSLNNVEVNNVSVPERAIVNIQECKEISDEYPIYESFKHQDWETFICRLIEYGYLD